MQGLEALHLLRRLRSHRTKYFGNLLEIHRGLTDDVLAGLRAHAVRQHLEALHRDATNDVTDDPGYAGDYRKRLEAYARAREALAGASPLLKKRKETGDAYLDRYAFTGKPKTARKTVAETRSKMGIVVPPKKYRPLGKKDPFEGWNYDPKPAEVKRFVAGAHSAALAGFPGTALKLGHDLWIYRDFHRDAAALLDLAYETLGRDVLRAQLKKALAWRKKCDAEARR